MLSDDARVSALERMFERMDERLGGKLGQPDAVKLMDHSVQGDVAVKKEFVERLVDFRSEVREAFKHNEKETAASIYRATKESEERLTAALTTLSNAVAALAPPPIERRAVHPAVSYGGGGAGLATAVAVFLYFLTNGHFGMPG